MVYTKKTWVNVDDPSNLPSIPEGQDALARFDAENMNRIEDGVSAAKNHLENTSLHNGATDGGGALGNNANTKGGAGAVGSGASAESGGAVGSGAKAISGGAIGYQAQTTSGGGAAGYTANTLSGGAVGSGAKSTNGGAVGNGARTSSGAAIGLGAVTADESNVEIDAVQLGTGRNKEPKTMQVYDYQIMRSDGTIPDERLPMFGKTQSGSYVGTGYNSEGVSLKVSLSFNFTPKYVFVKKQNGVLHGHFFYGENAVNIFSEEYCRDVVAEWSDKKLEWQCTDKNFASYGLNTKGSIYSWFAIG